MKCNAPLTQGFMSSSIRFLSWSGAIALAWTSLFSLPAIAQSPPDFSRTGRSGNRVGGASRGGCPTTDLPMMPLVPVDADYGGQTTEAQPTFWVYVPYGLDENSPVTFAVHDEDGNDLYQETFETTILPGVYGIELPASVELAVDSYYDWYVLVYCNDPLRHNVPAYASGWVQRVAFPDAIDAIAVSDMSPTEQSQVFANQLLWYDALTPLGESLQANQHNSEELSAWMDLLELPSVKLDEFAEFPLVSCCAVGMSEHE